MTINELIKDLEAACVKHGDIEVGICHRRVNEYISAVEKTIVYMVQDNELEPPRPMLSIEMDEYAYKNVEEAS